MKPVEPGINNSFFELEYGNRAVKVLSMYNIVTCMLWTVNRSAHVMQVVVHTEAVLPRL